jgi:ubiquinone/menaquinone biosynthesis C-methylase UbiE
LEDEKVRKSVRKGYAKVAKRNSGCCASEKPSCGCTGSVEEISKAIGYSEEELSSVPEGSNMGLGCGNPVALAWLREGETVLDLGSGGGFDCFLAASRVGPKGKVIGVDMTPEMVDKARENLRKSKHRNVEFRLGEIENLPVADGSVDVIISNCVINLSPDKKRVFEEAFRVLKPGGRLMVSDIVLLKELPEEIKTSIEAYVGCVAGAMLKDEYLGTVGKAGFKDVRIAEETQFPVEYLIDNEDAKTLIKKTKIPIEKVKETANSVISIKVHATKPEN